MLTCWIWTNSIYLLIFSFCICFRFDSKLFHTFCIWEIQKYLRVFFKTERNRWRKEGKKKDICTGLIPFNSTVSILSALCWERWYKFWAVRDREICYKVFIFNFVTKSAFWCEFYTETVFIIIFWNFSKIYKKKYIFNKKYSEKKKIFVENWVSFFVM